MVEPNELLKAMRAESIPAAASGLWYVTKCVVRAPRMNERHGQLVVLPPDTYTFLYRLTDSTLHKDPPGEVVMEDTPFELQTHLDFILRASGEVLVTGLGLGCVVRGLLANPAVRHVTCIENSPDVLQLVAAHLPRERLSLIEADALAWTAENRAHFDFAWHDLWTNRDEGEPHLDEWHTRLLINCRKTVAEQGAWALHHRLKDALKRMGFQLIG